MPCPTPIMRPPMARMAHALALLALLAALVLCPRSAVGDLATSHPRLWFTPEDLPALRARFNPSDPAYANGLKPVIDHAILAYDTTFFPGGSPAVPFPDLGGITSENYPCESFAQLFAFMSLAEPDPAKALDYAQRARRLLMHVVDGALPGQDATAPFRHPNFAIYDRARWWGESFGLTVDWIQYHPGVLTAQDKAKIQTLYLRWAAEINTGFHSPAQIPAAEPKMRYMVNNYVTGLFRNLLLMTLCLDPADDPPVDPNLPVTAVGNTLRSYQGELKTKWMTRFATIYMNGGSCSGGLHPEGPDYGGENFGFLIHAILAMQSSGFDDPAHSGPFGAIANDRLMDDIVDAALATIAQGPEPARIQSYLGLVCHPANYGDAYRYYLLGNPSTWGPLYLLSKRTGHTNRLEKLQWLIRNAAVGGEPDLWRRASNIFEAHATLPISYFVTLEPGSTPPADPRPGLDPVFFQKPFGRILARTDWSPSHRLFTYKCSWNNTGHQLGDGNMFEFLRKGEWLTKELTGASLDSIAYTPDYHNTLSIQNDTPGNLQWNEQPIADRGGQWITGANNGDPAVMASFASGFVSVYGDATNLYNKPSANNPAHAAMDVTHASRSLVWFKPDTIFVYDRAETNTANRFKRFNLTLPSMPVIVGRTITVSAPGNQKLQIDSLLPANASLQGSAAEQFMNWAEEETISHRLVVEDPARPSSVRFLHVLQGADASDIVENATLLASGSGGEPFDGASVGSVAVYFRRSTASPMTQAAVLTFPSSASKRLVAGFAPGSAFTVVSSRSGTDTITLTPGGGPVVADEGGLIDLSAGTAAVGDWMIE